MFLLGFAIILFCFGLSVTILGGDLSNFIDIPSLLFILGSILAVLTETQSFKVFYSGLRAAVLPKEDISEELRGRAASLFRLLSKVAAISAAIGMLISLTNLLFNLNFTSAGDVWLIGINIAASLITPLYGLFLIIAVFEPVVFILKKRSTGRK